MLDHDLCPPTTYTWVEWTWQFSHLLTKPVNFPLKFIWLGLFAGIVGFSVAIFRNPTWRQRFFRQWRWQRWWTRAAIALTIIGLLVTSPPGIALATQVLVSLVPQSSATNADAIVVLGRGSRLEGSRANTALMLWQERDAPKIFISGHGDAARLVKRLEAEGVPRQALDGDECSITTEQNARFTANILMPQGVRRIFLVTDSPHMLRSLLTFQRQGFVVIPRPSSLPDGLSHRDKMMVMLREYGGLITYFLQGRIFDHAQG